MQIYSSRIVAGKLKSVLFLTCVNRYCLIFCTFICTQGWPWVCTRNMFFGLFQVCVFYTIGDFYLFLAGVQTYTVPVLVIGVVGYGYIWWKVQILYALACVLTPACMCVLPFLHHTLINGICLWTMCLNTCVMQNVALSSTVEMYLIFVGLLFFTFYLIILHFTAFVFSSFSYLGLDCHLMKNLDTFGPYLHNQAAGSSSILFPLWLCLPVYISGLATVRFDVCYKTQF